MSRLLSFVLLVQPRPVYRSGSTLKNSNGGLVGKDLLTLLMIEFSEVKLSKSRERIFHLKQFGEHVSRGGTFYSLAEDCKRSEVRSSIPHPNQPPYPASAEVNTPFGMNQSGSYT
jgi:hypothetical protein